jgi:hypothetical protein
MTPPAVSTAKRRGDRETLKERAETELRTSLSQLPPEEAAVLALLQQRMEQQMRADANHGRH